MNTSIAAPILASMGREYNPQGPLASAYLGMALYLIAAVSIAVFVVRIMRRRNQPPRSFAPECLLAFFPILCATAYLVLGNFRILEVSSRVQISHHWLKQRIVYDLRPLGMALVASSLMLLLIPLVKAVIKRNARRNGSND